MTHSQGLAVTEGSTEKVTIAFVDDHPILLEGIATLFRRNDRFQVVATGATADDALRIAAEHKPSVLFMDLSMPGNVFGAISNIVRSGGDTRVMVFTAFSSVDSALRALDAGATGFILKGSSCDELFDAVECVMRDEVFITREYASQVMSGLRNRARREEMARAIKLSVREKQIVGHLLKGHTNREIAEVLVLSEKTVKHYMTGLMSKLNARNRVEVVIEAQKNGTLD